MKEFIHNFKCMITYLRIRNKHETFENYYLWHKYLVLFDIEQFLNKFKIKNKKSDLPF